MRRNDSSSMTPPDAPVAPTPRPSRLPPHGGTLIRNVRRLDPSSGSDSIGDVAFRDGVIVDAAGGDFAEVIDGSGHWLLPGVVDLCARTREPGATQKGTMRSETHAALAAGITAICLPPDTRPVIDSTAMVNRVNRIAKAAAGTYVHMLGALTKGLDGEALAEISALKAAGCVGVSNGLTPMASALVARRALEYAASLGMTVHVVPLDAALANNGCAHEGAVATRLGLAPIPVAAEAVAMRQWISLVEDTGARVHFGRLSSARGVELLASAKRRGLPVTADVAAHQLFLSEHDLEGFNAMAHVLPPLRARADRDALRAAVGSGLIDAICSDHQPHEVDAKTNPLPLTEPGISAVDTLLPLSLRLVHDGLLSPLALAERLSAAPSRILGLPAASLAPGAKADLCLVDPTNDWRLTPAAINSVGRNTPFIGERFEGRAVRVWRG